MITKISFAETDFEFQKGQGFDTFSRPTDSVKYFLKNYFKELEFHG